jgi:hypothetical protein
MIEAGLMRPELDWLIAAELERRQATGPAGWEVQAAQALDLDLALRRDVAALRTELEPLVARIVPLLGQVIRLSDRVCDTAEAVSADKVGMADGDVWHRVWVASGVRELERVFARLGAVFPKGTVKVDQLAVAAHHGRRRGRRPHRRPRLPRPGRRRTSARFRSGSTGYSHRGGCSTTPPRVTSSTTIGMYASLASTSARCSASTSTPSTC